MNVWIEQDSCIGNGICEELCPDMFVVKGGKAYVLVDGAPLPSGLEGIAEIPVALEPAVLDAAEACPAECIFVEVD